MHFGSNLLFIYLDKGQYNITLMTSSVIPSSSSYDFIIVGGGVYGLCIAYYLSKNSNINTLLIQQFTIGHDLGSSHSPTRITRSTYEKQLYRDLNLKALAENWKEMESLLNHKFVYETPYIYYDDQEWSYDEFRKVAEGKDNFRFMSPQNICQNYPAMPLIKSKFTPIVDVKAGILAADDFISKLKTYLTQKCTKNLTVMENTKVTKIYETQTGVNVEIQNVNIFQCKKTILSSGRWISELVPDFKNYFNVIKQYVSYLELKEMPKYDISKFYSFYYKETDLLHFFSMADHKGWGVKLGRHNLFELKPEEDNMEFQHKFFEQKARMIFGDEFIKINKIQNCYYTVTKTHDFILDYVDPSTEKILVCSCCSGHGFKFSPIIGDIAAQLVIGEKRKNGEMTNNEVYNTWKHMFKFAYHQGIDLN